MGKTLAQAFNRQPRTIAAPSDEWPLPTQETGIELEMEQTPVGHNRRQALSSFWEVHNDGSLRGGLEFVLREPMYGTKLSAAIRAFFEHVQPTVTPRASTHIHLNMFDDVATPETVRTLVALTFVLEDGLFGIADMNRKWCGYAQPLDDLDIDTMTAVMQVTDDEESISRMVRQLGQQSSRYYGLNLASLTKYGSIEFRYFPTAPSAEVLRSWVCLTHSLRKVALRLTTEELLDALSDGTSYTRLLRQDFTEWADALLHHVPPTAAAQRAALLRNFIALPGSTYRGPHEVTLQAFIGKRPNQRAVDLEALFPEYREAFDQLVNTVAGYWENDPPYHAFAGANWRLGMYAGVDNRPPEGEVSTNMPRTLIHICKNTGAVTYWERGAVPRPATPAEAVGVIAYVATHGGIPTLPARMRKFVRDNCVTDEMVAALARTDDEPAPPAADEDDVLEFSVDGDEIVWTDDPPDAEPSVEW